MKDTFEKRWSPIKRERETYYFVLFGNKSLLFPTKEVTHCLKMTKKKSFEIFPPKIIFF
eukprot:13031.XXX_536849_537025_1 [CDS] Oithona nana genome sequencing.